ncbi:hypothetical protein DFJ77DRAFT_276236 [Powellomyces hirtus]|nr:hypothetical protein DFJ77DRAFT_276236 [Powellomyces hirtus]
MDRVFAPRWSTNGPAGASNSGSNGANRSRTATTTATTATTITGSAGGTTRTNGFQGQPRPRTSSASSTLGSLGTKDIVLGPGGGFGRPLGSVSSHGSTGSLGSAAGHAVATGNLQQSSRKNEKRERNVSQNGYIPLSAWRGPSSSNGSSTLGGPSSSASGASARQQPWPQLNSATLGTFSKPIVTPPAVEPSSPTDSSGKETSSEVPVSFENNFPSLGGGITVPSKASSSGVAGKAAKPKVAWGKADVVSIVASHTGNGTKSEQDVDSAADDEEAAEIARLKALIPRLDKPKMHGKGMAAIRERSKSVSAVRVPFSGLNGRSATVSTTGMANGRPSILSKPTQMGSNGSQPMLISNRPKLRSTMKASPRSKHGFPQASEDKNTEAATSPVDIGDIGEPSCSDQIDASSSETSRGSSTNGEDLSDCDAVESSTEAFQQQEESPRHEKEKVELVARQEAGIFDLDCASEEAPLPVVTTSEQVLSSWSSRSTTPGPSTPDSDNTHRARTRSSSRDLGSDSHDDSDRSSSHVPSTVVGSYTTQSAIALPRPAPYESTFQYSASLEKEESFLRTLGWDRSAYYDSDVDESEFVITQEEKEEFFKGYARLLGASNGNGNNNDGNSNNTSHPNDLSNNNNANKDIDFESHFYENSYRNMQHQQQQRRYEVPAQSRHVRLLDTTGDAPVLGGTSARFPSAVGTGPVAPLFSRRFTAF